MNKENGVYTHIRMHIHTHIHTHTHTHTTMDYYSALKKNEVMAFAGKWMQLEKIMLSEISQT